WHRGGTDFRGEERQRGSVCEGGGNRVCRLSHRGRASGRRAGDAGRAEQFSAVADSHRRAVSGLAGREQGRDHAGAAACADPDLGRNVAGGWRPLAQHTGARGDGSDPALTPALAHRHGRRNVAMIHHEQLWLFFALVFGIVVLPGLDMAFVMGSTLAGGRSRGLAAVAGIIAGGVCHVLMTALGISVMIKLIPGMFNALLLAGALYIAWIGISLLRSESSFGLRPDTR